MVEFIPNAFVESVQWSRDGKYLMLAYKEAKVDKKKNKKIPRTELSKNLYNSCLDDIQLVINDFVLKKVCNKILEHEEKFGWNSDNDEYLQLILIKNKIETWIKSKVGLGIHEIVLNKLTLKNNRSIKRTESQRSKVYDLLNRIETEVWIRDEEELLFLRNPAFKPIISEYITLRMGKESRMLMGNINYDFQCHASTTKRQSELPSNFSLPVLGGQLFGSFLKMFYKNIREKYNTQGHVLCHEVIGGGSSMITFFRRDSEYINEKLNSLNVISLQQFKDNISRY